MNIGTLLERVVCLLNTVTIMKLIVVLRHYNNYHFGQSGLLVDYCGSEYFRRRESGVYSHAFSANTYADTYDGSPNYLIIGYHWGSNTPHTSLAYGGFCSFTRDVGLHTDASTNASDTYPEVCIRLSKN